MRVIRNCKYCKMNKTMEDERNTKKANGLDRTVINPFWTLWDSLCGNK